MIKLEGGCILLLIFCTISTSIAQEQDNIFTLGEVEVTATRKEPINQSAGRVLGQEEMHLRQQDTVGQALDLLPGVNSSSLGARNEQTVYIQVFNIIVNSISTSA